MTKPMETIYFDRANGVWVYRIGDGPVSSITDLCIRYALDAIDKGRRPDPIDLAALRAEFPRAIFIDSGGNTVGELFPGNGDER